MFVIRIDATSLISYNRHILQRQEVGEQVLGAMRMEGTLFPLNELALRIPAEDALIEVLYQQCSMSG